MNRKLNFRRPQGVLRNYRNPGQDLSPRESPGICPGCGNLDIRHFEPAEGDKRVFADCPSRTVQAIVLRTASLSCHACRAILGTLETGGLGQFNDEEPVYLKAFEKKLVVEMYQPRDLPGGRFEIYRHQQPETPPKLWPAVGTARTLTPSFSVAEAYPLIASWMEECKSKHADCTGEANSPLPTRLIAVGIDREVLPHLHETGPNEAGQYIALSHCWGPPEHRPPRTTKSNLSQRKKSIPVEDLPPTFRDTLRLSRALGIKYIWIDSLCIIQDDGADWEREAARMQDVYRNAVLTVSADGAADSRGGLFKPVSERKLPTPVKTCCSADGNQAAVGSESQHLYGRKTDLNVNLDGIFGVHTAGSSSSSEGEPLSRRGWTFQEWILSRRIVHFATGELLWDCLTAEGCECQGFLKPRASPSGVRRRGLTDELEHWGMRDRSWHWGMMVNNYTNRHLTFDSDKLHALSGVAKFSAMDRDAGDCYIAGLWNSELPLSLLWRRDVARSGSDIGYRRPEKYLAPSWSWASIVGPVLCENLKRGMALCEVLEVSYQLASGNPYGPVQTGSLMIRGPVARISGCVDIQGEQTLETRRQRSINTVFIKDVPERSQSVHGEDAVLLAVRSCWDARAHSLVWEGLALEAVGNSQDCFTRIGVVTLGVKAQTRFARWWRKTRSRERSHEILIGAIGAVVQTISII